MEALFRIKYCFCCHFLIAGKGVREPNEMDMTLTKEEGRAGSWPFSVREFSCVVERK